MTIRAQIPVRDPLTERRFIERASYMFSGRGFAEHVAARLDDGDRKFGNQWQSLPLDRFLCELLEEAADLAAWASLALQAHAPGRHTGPVDAHLAVGLLEVARCGAKAHHVISALALADTQERENVRSAVGMLSVPRRARWWRHLLPGGRPS